MRTRKTFFITSCHPHQSFGIALWRAHKPLSVGILSNAFQKRAHSSCEVCLPCCLLSGGRGQPGEGGLGYVGRRQRKVLSVHEAMQCRNTPYLANRVH